MNEGYDFEVGSGGPAARIVTIPNTPLGQPDRPGAEL